MSIRVICPNGCSISVPGKQKGKMVQCPDCKSQIRVPRAGVRQDQGTVFLATLIAAAGEIDESLANHATELKSVSDLVETPQRIQHRRSSTQVKNSGNREAANNNGEPRDANPFDFLTPESNHVPIEIQEITEILPLAIDRHGKAGSDTDDVVIELDRNQARIDRQRDRIWLTRFYAFCLFVVGVINVVPVIVFMIAYGQQVSESVLPRWAFLSIFLSLVFLAYAVYLVQLADWTSLFVVSVFVLVVACVYGFLAAALWLGSPTGTVAQGLQLPQSYFQFGPIWGGIMFCLAALASFTFGLDALIWQQHVKHRQPVA